MISSASDYRFVTGANVDATHPHGDLDRITIDGGIMPLRDGTTTNATDTEITAKNILRGEDIAFLMEGGIERKRMLNGSSFTIGYTPGVHVTYAFDECTDTMTFSRCVSRAQRNAALADAFAIVSASAGGYPLFSVSATSAEGYTISAYLMCLTAYPSESPVEDGSVVSDVFQISSSPSEPSSSVRLTMADIQCGFGALSCLDTYILLTRLANAEVTPFDWFDLDAGDKAVEDRIGFSSMSESVLKSSDVGWVCYDSRAGDTSTHGEFWCLPSQEMTAVSLSSSNFARAELWAVVQISVIGSAEADIRRLVKVSDGVVDSSSGMIQLKVSPSWYKTTTDRLLGYAQLSRLHYTGASSSTQEVEIYEEFFAVAVPIIETKW